MITRSSPSLLLLSPSCKNVNVAHYTKPETLAHHDNMQLQAMEYNSESYSFGLMSLLTFK